MKTALLVIGIVALPLAISERQGEPLKAPDHRLQRLHHFFNKHRSPLRDLAIELLIAADQNGLDWRLLPSISIVESGGGKACRNNNVFGWRSGEQRFPSVTAGIQHVAERLANSKIYKGKDIAGKLNAYNPVPGYQLRIEAVMRALEQTEIALGNVSGPVVW